MNKSLQFTALLLLISFASVNAVLFTPALPEIATFFGISNGLAQHTISWFLLGYTFGQLIYGPLANRFGRKPALYSGIGVQIFSSLLCAFSGKLHLFSLLVVGRFLLALGSGVGLKMTFTLVYEYYTPEEARQKIAYLMLSFALTPGLGVALGGMLNTYFGWASCFYASAVYGVLLFWLTLPLKETQTVVDVNALKPRHLFHSYITQFANKSLVLGALLMGNATTFIYIFAALAPFIAINLLGMNSAQYGIANLIPLAGLVVGLFASAELAKKYSLSVSMGMGLIITGIGILAMILAIMLSPSPIVILFLPVLVIYFGLSLILPNASTLAMSNASDKAHGSAVMSFINMGFATAIVLSLSCFTTSLVLLPILYSLLVCIMICLFLAVKK